ncbi:MAG: glycosyltransferase [Gemmatimonadetes bacterium]|nr:glycosyltransferase [Gemmatimonadota bacterium]
MRALLVAGIAAVVVLGGTVVAGILRPPVVEPLPMASADVAPGALAGGTRPTRRPGVRGAAAVADDADCARLPKGAAAARRCRPMPVARAVAAPAADPIVAGFLVQWDAGSRAALTRFGAHLDWAIVEGAFMGRGEFGRLTITLDKDLLAEARQQGVATHLMVTNFGATNFDPTLLTTLLATPARRARAIRDLVDAVSTNQLAGVCIDFELVPAAMHPAVLDFMRELRAALRPLNAIVTVATPIGEEDGYPLAEYAAASDYVIAMLYDEHSGDHTAGAIASAPWFAARLDSVLAAVPAAQVILGVGQYGYHWRSDREEGVTVSVSEAMAFGRAAPGGVRFDAATRNPTAQWRTDGVTHTVWYLDATTAWNQLRSGLRAGAAGTALWRLGSEDESLWSILTRSGLTGSPDALRSLPDKGVSVISGDGEILAVEGRTGRGARALQLDADGYVAQASITQAPGGYVVSRAGVPRDRRVALTFDDGPDADYTPPILDTLASRGAVASFFVLGRQVQRLPDITRRIADEGHEIGNHSWSHPDFASLGESAIRMELAATGRAIEAVTGRRPLLARPPYIGDARPATEDRLRPMAIANTMGYRIAGLEVDPKDWFEIDARAIVANALRELRRKDGRIILLHDAGGDRSATIAALGPLIDSLRANGYTLTTVAGLLDGAAAAGTPVAPASEAPQRVLTGVAMRAAVVVETTFVVAFLVALVLGVVRLLLIGGLAAWQRWRPGVARRATDRTFTPMVSVLIPAYNEGRVITRTIASVLAQDYPDFEVVVIDDGSRDDTAAAAESMTSDARVRVLRQANAGKAAALNTGIAAAAGAVLVVIDADTVLAPDALLHLVHPLADRRVGAVAGNAKVGNRVNLVTRWQAVEYVTSQNLDRRAFVLLNCITVVPGAIGAWRREAVLAAGGFRTDTLAEDQDLTLTLLRAGHRVALADHAIAYTEAPETFAALLKQRFRWSFGTLQCAWKHRAALGRREAGALGLVGLPNIWLFQLLFPLLAPAADIALIAMGVRLALEAPAIGWHAAWSHAQPVAVLYGLFLAIDTLTAFMGVFFERGETRAQALLVPLQRIAYRQVLYIALVKAMRAALKGWNPSWGKLERTGRVQQPALRVVDASAPAPPPPGAPFDGVERRKAS